MNTQTRNRAHWLFGASFLLVGLAVANYPAHAQALDSTGVKAVPTYEAVGLYWANPGANAATGCEVKFRAAGTTSWTQGLAMWFDARNSECRGSLVNLVPGTTYEAQVNLPGLAATKGVTFKTWSNTLPVAKTINVPSGSGTLNITEGGSAAGYVVYQGGTLDAQNAAQYNVTVNASYVIVRGFTLKGAQQDAIRISPNVNDVVVEDSDISGWGRTRDGKWGTDMDSGIRAVCANETQLARVTIQRNKIHEPRYGANSWSDGHPAGPQAVTISYCSGNHVIRWNEMYSVAGKYFNDVIGGEDNFSNTGFPNKDTDIYGNRLSNSWDDAIEAEGGNKNVRIWGNYIDNTATGVATTVTATGPVYIFRNVFNRNRFYEKTTADADDRQPFFKSGSDATLGNGRRYLLHNTMLQATQSGSAYGLGGGAGVGGTGSAQLINNTVSMNNIYHLWKPNSMAYQVGTGNTFERDMYNGSAGTAVVSGINAAPAYASGNGWQSEANGLYALAAGTPGFDQASRIANFNDSFVGAGPDVGAAEAGAGAMKFGLAAANATPASAPPATPTPGPTPAPGTGTAAVSSTLMSSKISSAAGESITLTVKLLGNSGTPTGTVTFKANGNAIAGCSSVSVGRGNAYCTTSALASGASSITGAYSGSTTYQATVAGPITQTVGGSTAAPPPAPPPAPAPVGTSLSIDSSQYTIAYGTKVTFTVRVTGNAPAGTVTFTANGSAVRGCSAMAVTNGVATCSTTTIARGANLIRGNYSGDANNGAGVAGPITQTVS
jgi:Big-like domain-containing protein